MGEYGQYIQYSGQKLKHFTVDFQRYFSTNWFDF